MMKIEDDSLQQKRHHRSAAAAKSALSMETEEGTANGRVGGNGSALGYPFKYRNCRRSKLPKPVPQQQQQQQQLQKSPQKYPSEEMLYNEPNLVPKMELLKINYFNMPRKSTVQLKQMTSRSRSSVQDIKDDLIKKCGGGGSGNGNVNVNRATEHRSASSSVSANKSSKVPEAKYAVYKKHNLHDDQHRLHQQQQQQQRHQLGPDKNSKVFDFDSVKFRKKYFLFDTKRRNNKKLDNIQFYFDNKSYERHVDNKLYGSAQASAAGATHYGQSSANRREQQPAIYQELPKTTTKMSTWKDHLNNTRLGHVRQLQSKYESHAKQSETSGGFRVQQKVVQGQKVIEADLSRSGNPQSRREKPLSHYDIRDTDKLIKPSSGLYRRQGDQSISGSDNQVAKKKKNHHQLSVMGSSSSKQRRESTTELESTSKIKRLVQDFERKSPTSGVEGRENFILFQRMGSADNLMAPSSDHKTYHQRQSLNGGDEKKPEGRYAKLIGKATEIRQTDDYYSNEGHNDRQQPLCKNIRSPRPTSMPIGSSSSSSTSQMVTVERIEKMTEKTAIKHCGYKNCHFQNCPMTASSSSTSTSSGCDSSSCSTISCASEKCAPPSPINIVHRNHSAEVEQRISPDYHRHYDKIRNGRVMPLVKSLLPKSRTERISNIKQLERRIVTKYISDELRLLSNNAREDQDDGYEPVSPYRPESEEDDYEANKVKIYVGGSFKAKNSEQLEDSDKDYGYYDQVTADSGSCSENSFGSRRRAKERHMEDQAETTTTTTTAISDDSLVNIMDVRSDLMGKLGCDGAIFWNENCYEEECSKVPCSVKEPYVCVCGSSSKVTQSADGLDWVAKASLENFFHFSLIKRKALDLVSNHDHNSSFSG